MKLAAKHSGLTGSQVISSRNLHGGNTIKLKEDRVFLQVLRDVITEPMFILLLAACIIYFIAGQLPEGIIMLVSIFFVSGISFFQEYRSRNAVRALKKLSAGQARVFRDGLEKKIDIEEIVVDDLMLLEEGEVVPADGRIAEANDFALNESILTGEAFSISKDESAQNEVYKGTLVTSGSALVKVTAVGLQTRFGKIGLSLKEISIAKTPLQLQIRRFVRNMVWIGGSAFLIIVGFNYFKSGDLMQAFLQGLTLAMSILPEEIPVAFSTFQALGAYRLLKYNIVVKQPQYVETLGSATVIGVDKTGTLTQNKMQIDYVYDAVTSTSLKTGGAEILPDELIEYAMWASETTPFDPMEIAIHALYSDHAPEDLRPQYKQEHEYPIGGKPPIMTHIFKNESGKIIIASKGAMEGILQQSKLSADAIKKIETQTMDYAKLGYRVLGVGKGRWEGTEWPATQQEFTFEFLGLIAFQDPPKENISQTVKTFEDAGISVKMITGDYVETAVAIADQIHLKHNQKVLTGTEVLQLGIPELKKQVKDINIYARMFPEAKLKVIEALKENGEVVAMTGDGVNDGPALKAAHIGIAMGLRGSGVAKSAASLIITDDDLSHMTDAIALGRKIYNNLEKAIQYIVSIHIPIILIVTIPLILAWKFTNIFSPVHVIFLELLMGPTCSIIYENEPMEPGIMNRPPIKGGKAFLSLSHLSISIIQGLGITIGCLGIGYYYLQLGESDTTVRTLIFITLLFSNIFLTLVNRSFEYSIYKTLAYKNNLVPLIIGFTLMVIIALLYLPFMQQLFKLTALPFPLVVVCVGVALVSTFWIEIWKVMKKKNRNGE